MNSSGESDRRPRLQLAYLLATLWVLLVTIIGVPMAVAEDGPETEAMALRLLDALSRGDRALLRDLSSTRRPGRERQAWLDNWVEGLRDKDRSDASTGSEFTIVEPTASEAYDPSIMAYRVQDGIRVLAEPPDRLLSWRPGGVEERVGLVLSDGAWRWVWPVEEVRGGEIVQAFNARQSVRRRGAPLRGLPPLPLHVVTPLAPASMVDSGSGCARLVFTVRADGLADAIRFNSSPNSAYGKAARDALREWRFAPTEEEVQAFQSFAFEVNTKGRWTAGFNVGGTDAAPCRGLPWP